MKYFTISQYCHHHRHQNHHYHYQHHYNKPHHRHLLLLFFIQTKNIDNIPSARISVF